MISKITKVLKNGGVVAMPTDTIYGILGQALDKQTVERIYQIKQRTPSKPLIILISDIAQLKKFKVDLNQYQKDFLAKYWPGAVSVILECQAKNFDYLTRGTSSLAFRIPAESFMNGIIEKAGPLVAPSANPEGEKPTENIEEAKAYFGKKVDLFYDGSKTKGVPSTLVLLKKKKYTILRQGAVEIV